MGRGRAKAKQTKVARELKYRPVGTDLNALRAELTGSNGSGSDQARKPAESADELEDDDPYASYAEDDDEEADRSGSPR